MITLYTSDTINGHKISIALEFLEIQYKVHVISFQNNDQNSEWFTKINPNGKIPAIVDHSNDDFTVFESGAILLYLAEHYDKEHKLFTNDPKLRSKVQQWLMWQISAIGPMLGQNNFFRRYARVQLPYCIERYGTEANRLLKVLETQLKNSDYVVLSQVSAADIAIFPWVRFCPLMGVTLDDFPLIKAWLERLESKPYVQKGLNVPIKNNVKEMISDPNYAKDQAKEAADWIYKIQEH